MPRCYLNRKTRQAVCVVGASAMLFDAFTILGCCQLSHASFGRLATAKIRKELEKKQNFVRI
jgi:hypothetical protein